MHTYKPSFRISTCAASSIPLSWPTCTAITIRGHLTLLHALVNCFLLPHICPDIILRSSSSKCSAVCLHFSMPTWRAISLHFTSLKYRDKSLLTPLHEKKRYVNSSKCTYFILDYPNAQVKALVLDRLHARLCSFINPLVCTELNHWISPIYSNKNQLSNAPICTAFVLAHPFSQLKNSVLSRVHVSLCIPRLHTELNAFYLSYMPNWKPSF